MKISPDLKDVTIGLLFTCILLIIVIDSKQPYSLRISNQQIIDSRAICNSMNLAYESSLLTNNKGKTEIKVVCVHVEYRKSYTYDLITKDKE